MKNLRNGRPTGRPAGIGVAKGRLIHTAAHADGSRSMFFHDGTKLYVLTPDATFLTLMEVSGDVSVGNAGINAASGQPFVELTAGTTRLSAKYSGSTWSATVLTTNPLDNLMLRPRVIQTVHHVVSPRKLRGTYGQGSSTLESDDIAALTADLLEGVAMLEAKARVAGGVIYPRLAHAVAYDSEGNIVASTLPVLLSPENSMTETAVITVSADSSIGSIELTATAYDVETDRIGDTLPDGIARIETVTSEPLSPIDPKAPVGCRRAGLSTSGPNFEISLPGIQLGRSDNNRLRTKILDTLRSLMATSGVRCNICPRRCCLPGRQRCRLENRQGKTASSGTLNVSVAPRCLLNAIPSPMNYALDADNSAWTATTATVFNYRGTDSSRDCVERRTLSATTLRPLTLSPLIVIPDGDAKSHTIVVGDSGVTLAMTAADGYSYYLSSDLQPIDLSNAELPSVPSANPARPRTGANAIAVADAASPMTTLIGARLADGTEIFTVTPAARSRSTWDFGRAHFYLMTSTGIYALAINSGRTRVDSSLIDARCINSGAAVALTSRGVIAGVGKSLILITGTSATDIATLPSEPVALGWDNLRGELRIKCADGAALISDSGFTDFTESDFNPDAYYSIDGRLYATGSNTLYRVDADELERQLTEIVWERYFDTPAGKRPVAVRWDVTGSAIQGSFDLTSDTGARLLRLAVDGRLVAPLSARFLAPRRERLKARISAIVSADTVIRGVTVKYSSAK